MTLVGKSVSHAGPGEDCAVCDVTQGDLLGWAIFGPLTPRDEERLAKYAESHSPPARKGLRCLLGLHTWELRDLAGKDEDRLNVSTCKRCGVERASASRTMSA